jgi:hypothetical protein
VPAKLLNTAGIVGAAWLANDAKLHPDMATTWAKVSV